MSALVTVPELVARCDWAFDDDEERAAPGYLEEASDLVRAYGKETWTASNAPRMAKSICISVVRRFMRNPEGYVQSRAGDETLGFTDLRHDAGSMYLTQSEIKLVRGLAGSTPGLQSASAMAWGPHDRISTPDIVRAPVSGWPGEKPFPYDTSEPW